MLSDSRGDDVQVKDARKYDHVIWEKGASSRLIFLVALSQSRGPDYLGAWSMAGPLAVILLFWANPVGI